MNLLRRVYKNISLSRTVIANQRGSLTVDYLFAFFLVSGLSLIILTFSTTLTMVEVAQYIAYSSSRAFMLANVDIAKQKESAAKKYVSLKTNPTVAPILNGGWFVMPDESFIVDYNIPEKYPQFSGYQPSPTINLFHGVILGFQAKILDFQIPFFGGTKLKGQDDDKTAFYTNITSFLGREPTYSECQDFNEKRWNQIKQLGGANYGITKDNGGYIVISDNGC